MSNELESDRAMVMNLESFGVDGVGYDENFKSALATGLLKFRTPPGSLARCPGPVIEVGPLFRSWGPRLGSGVGHRRLTPAGGPGTPGLRRSSPESPDSEPGAPAGRTQRPGL
jgi:hypothetical protein